VDTLLQEGALNTDQQVVGQHTQKDVSFDSSLEMIKDGSFAQGTFYGAESSLKPAHMNRFIAGDRAPNSPEGAKMLTRADPALDRPMTLFQYIVEILPGRCPQFSSRAPSALSCTIAGG